MATIHDLAAHAVGGLQGIQAAQRDWSPFVAHFTSFKAMAPLREAIRGNRSTRHVRELLGAADAASAEVACAIADSRELRAASPSQKDGIPPCVCFSECSLPGLLGHCERYGRFGFVFRKDAIYAAGGRPCVYVGPEEYGELARLGREQSAAPILRRLFGLANVYRPRGGGKVQDYTHEREWRLFGAVQLDQVVPEMLIAPAAMLPELRRRLPGVEVAVPIDVLHAWGL